MKMKIVGFLVCMLLIATAYLQIAKTMDSGNNTNDYECGCCSNNGIELTVGECDWFYPPPEPTYPSQALLNWINYNYAGTPGSRMCDEEKIDQFWAHTFDLTGICNQTYIERAVLNITLCNRDSTDSLNLGCIEDNSSTWDEAWLLTGSPVNLTVGVCDNRSFDLTDYPTLFNNMKSHEYLDVIVQDDSSVDCAILTIYCCDCELEIEIERGLHFSWTLPVSVPVKITNVGTSDCNLTYNITCKNLIGTAQCKINGSDPRLPPGEDMTVDLTPSGMGIVLITAKATACETEFIDTALVLIFRRFIFVFQ